MTWRRAATLERIDRAEVRLRRALRRSATPTPMRPNTVRESAASLPCLISGFDVVGQDDDVERLAGIHLFDQVGRQRGLGDELVPGGALELRGELLVGAARRAGDEDLDVGGLGGLGHENSADHCEGSDFHFLLHSPPSS